MAVMYRCDRCLFLCASELPLDGWRCRCVSSKPGVRPGEVITAEIYDPLGWPPDHPDDQPLRCVGTLAEYLGVLGESPEFDFAFVRLGPT